MISSGFYFALTAGFFAALSSVVIKLATSTEFVPTLATFILSFVSLPEYYVVLVLRAVTFGAGLGCNAIMMKCFVSAMNLLGSVTAVVTNTATNFLSTALFGYFLFQENLTLSWIFGAGLILSGLIVMHYSNTPLPTEAKVKDQ